jgi:glycolate oxidase iron-sulfur subunit
MQTNLSDEFRDTREGREADAILRSCVHCGFCTATCPTYQLLGDELDGPRGRIYLIKEMLEGSPVTAKTQTHLDRCLTCRNCETTCPSGVQYGRLVDIGRAIVERKVGRTATEAAQRWTLRRALLSPSLFGGALKLGRIAKSLLPQELSARIPAGGNAGAWPEPRHARKMIVPPGCVQPALKPNIDASMARVLDRIGISPLRVPGGGCCGALSHHLAADDEARAIVRRNIDAWWPLAHRGLEAIVVTASGCGVMVKDYGHFLAHDAAYAAKAKKIAELARDPIEIVT